MHELTTRNRAEAFRAAKPTPAPPEAHFSPAAMQLALTLLGAVLLGLIGAWL